LDTSICEATIPKESTMRLEVCPGDGGWWKSAPPDVRYNMNYLIQEEIKINEDSTYSTDVCLKLAKFVWQRWVIQRYFWVFSFSCLVSFSNSILWFRSYCWTQLLNSMSHQYFCVWLLYFKGVPLIYQ
jgi:hypothetical protein